MKLQSFIAAAALVASALPAQAALIQDGALLQNPAAAVDFEQFDGLITAGPESVAPGVTFSGGAGAELGAYIRDLGNNGVWGLGHHFAAGDDGVLTFTFDTLQAGSGAFLNHTGGGQVTVTAYGAGNAILETHTLGVTTQIDSYNDGRFVGVMRGAADIRSLSFSGMGMVADNLLYTTTPVPEPESLALLLAGLGIVLGRLAVRRRANR